MRRRSVDEVLYNPAPAVRMASRYGSLGSMYVPTPYVPRGRRSKNTMRYRKMGIQRGIAARVHTFKRVGEPIGFMNVDGNRIKPVGNTDLINLGTFGAQPDQFIQNASQAGIAWRFSLNQVANFTEITSLFDNYRLKKVTLTFTYTANVAMVPSNGGGQSVPIMHHAYDPDDDSTPVNRTSVLENGYTKTTRLERVFSIDIIPRAQSVINNGTGGVAGGLLARNTWLDCDSPDVKHYGEKCWLECFPYCAGGANDSLYTLVVTPTYTIEARNVV